MQALNAILLYFLNRKSLFAGFIAGGVILILHPPAGIMPEGWKTLALSATVMVWFIYRPVRPPAIALFIITFHVILGISHHTEVAGSFFNDSVFFIMGLLMIGTAMVKQRLDRVFGRFLLSLSKGDINRLTVITFLSAAAGGSLIGEYATSTILLPFVLLVIGSFDSFEERRISAKPLLFAIAVGCIIGAMCTPSGGARNVIMIQFLKENHNYTMEYHDWVRLAFPLVFFLLILGAQLIQRNFSKRTPIIVNLDKLFSGGELEAKFSPQEKLSIFILAITFILWLTASRWLGMGIIAVFGAVLFLIFDLVKWEDYNKNVNWGVVMLYAALVMLGSSIYNKGMADWVADLVQRLIADPALMKLILPIILIILMPLISTFIGAVGAVSIFGPLFMKISCRYGMECPVIGILLTMASSFAYLRFSASPASTIVFTTGYLRKGDFLKLGWKMVIYSAILLIIIAVFYWGY